MFSKSSRPRHQMMSLNLYRPISPWYDMPDYLEPDIPAKQREGVNLALRYLKQGKALPIWQALGDALCWIQRRGGLVGNVTLLDAGCSSAYCYEVIEHYVPAWVRYTGLDHSGYMIKEAAHHYPGLQIDLGNITDMPYEDKAFDIVMSGATLNHIYEWQTALRELARVTSWYLLLHRLPLTDEPTRYEEAEAYDHPILAIFFNKEEFSEILTGEGFECVWDEPVLDLKTQIWERAAA